MGCAIVGGAFYPPGFAAFPEETYDSTFFFADYCSGHIRYINKETGEFKGVFAEGLQRPLALLFSEYTGSLYFLSRAGVGGGSPSDNTGTDQGALWRIFYTGSGAPFVSADPASVLVSAGESARFKIQALGSDSLQYQWQQNAIDIPDATSPELLWANASLADSGSTFRCIVINEEGVDTSAAALLEVTSNQRPNPVIVSPAAGTFFHAGDTIWLEGIAEDAEDGILSAPNLCWQIDLHHNDHTHPAYSQTCGIDQDYYVIPGVTETDTNIWFRIYLTATDSGGLSETGFVEIYPELTTIYLDGPAGIEVNIDGKIRSLPHAVQSLIGLQRILEIDYKHQIGDSIFVFKHWSNGSEERLLTFVTPEEEILLEAVFESIPVNPDADLVDFSGEIEALEVYPNPGSDVFEISALLIEDARVQLQVFNTAGQKMLDQERVLSVGKNMLRLDLSRQPPGIYFLSLFDGDQWKSCRLIKLP